MRRRASPTNVCFWRLVSGALGFSRGDAQVCEMASGSGKSVLRAGEDRRRAVVNSARPAQSLHFIPVLPICPLLCCSVWLGGFWFSVSCTERGPKDSGALRMDLQESTLFSTLPCPVGSHHALGCMWSPWLPLHLVLRWNPFFFTVIDRQELRWKTKWSNESCG